MPSSAPTITIDGPDVLPDTFISALAKLLLSLDNRTAREQPGADGDNTTGHKENE